MILTFLNGISVFFKCNIFYVKQQSAASFLIICMFKKIKVPYFATVSLLDYAQHLLTDLSTYLKKEERN